VNCAISIAGGASFKATCKVCRAGAQAAQRRPPATAAPDLPFRRAPDGGLPNKGSGAAEVAHFLVFVLSFAPGLRYNPWPRGGRTPRRPDPAVHGVDAGIGRSLVRELLH